MITLTLVAILAIAAGLMLELSSGTYKLTMRNEFRAQARAVAESELEFILYRFKAAIINSSGGTAASAVASLSDIADIAETPDPTATPRATFLQAHQTAGWTVRRSVQLYTTDIGRIPNTTKVGWFSYIIARVEIVPPTTSPFAGAGTVRIGRRFINSSTSIFQNSIFFQGDLELNPGNDTTINGDISANGSIYMGPSSGHTLTLNSTVRYLTYFNSDAANDPGIYANPNAPAPPVTLVAPTFGPSGALEQLTTPENLISGLDAAAVAVGRPDLFGPSGRTDPSVWSTAELSTAENNVYRSLIVPPPAVAATTEYPNGSVSTVDDTVINALRAYSKAGLIITVSPTNTVSISKVVSGVATDVTSSFAPVTAATTNSYDEREGKTIKVTAIDVGALKTKIESSYTDFNGALYVNLQNSSSAAPAAVKLTNATSLPVVNAGGTTDTIKGFSVSTNGGLYVQGSYNTTAITNPDGTTRAIPAMLTADSITVLSSNYVDSAVSRPLTSRVASLSAAEIAAGGVAINSGLLTGNVASSAAKSSGGAQNLIRYQENWGGKSINYLGSIGRLFQSTQYTAPFTGPGTVYLQPASRVFSFDTNMQRHSPPGTPTTTDFSRGSFFTW